MGESINNLLYETTLTGSIPPLISPDPENYEHLCDACGIHRNSHYQLNHTFEEPVLPFIRSERCVQCGVPRVQHLSRHAFVSQRQPMALPRSPQQLTHVEQQRYQYAYPSQQSYVNQYLNQLNPSTQCQCPTCMRPRV